MEPTLEPILKIAIPIVVLLIALAIGIRFLSARAGHRGGSDRTSKDDASKLARLLISEIKLYDSALVEKAVGERNLYRHLGEELERARETFLERVGDGPEQNEAFDRAVVRILANGDESAVGRRTSGL